MKKIWIFLCFFVFLAEAATLNAIAIIVDKEPITLYEIDKAMKELKTSRANAIQALINDRIEQAQIKKMGMFVNDLELENEITKMLSQNGGDINELKASLKASGRSYDVFKKDFKQQLEKRKLYEAVASGAKVDYSEDGARSFYETNTNEFLLFTNISVSIYSSAQAQSLENLRNANVKGKNIKERSAVLTLQNTDPRLLVFLSRIENNAFSPVLENGNEFTLYKVRRKSLPQPLPYEEIKDEVSNVYVNKQRQDFIKDFFDKAHSKAQIIRLR